MDADLAVGLKQPKPFKRTSTWAGRASCEDKQMMASEQAGGGLASEPLRAKACKNLTGGRASERAISAILFI